jgi:glycosyltransferase involved in cell wall biosynthesis
LGLDNRIDFVGYLDDPRTAYSTFNIAVLSSHYEGQSMVVLEAMNAGLPVVAARVGGIPDTISDGVEGLLVPMEDAAAMAGAILQLAKDAGLRAMMGAAGRRRVVRDFGADTWVGNLLQLYSSILDVSVVPTA